MNCFSFVPWHHFSALIIFGERIVSVQSALIYEIPLAANCGVEVVNCSVVASSAVLLGVCSGS